MNPWLWRDKAGLCLLEASWLLLRLGSKYLEWEQGQYESS
jgi:hypothetical protein